MSSDSFPVVKMSKAGKMPCQSWSTPAEECITGSKLREVEGSTCSICYALKGHYHYPNVKALRIHNHNHIMACKHDADMREDWIRNVSLAIANDRYFRWFDSGDLQGRFQLDMIVEVAKRNKHCKFWLPTREYDFVQDWIMDNGRFPSNLTVRLSAHMKRKPVVLNETMQSMGIVGSTAGYSEKGKQCPAYKQDGKCGTCRACWSRRVKVVNYPEH